MLLGRLLPAVPSTRPSPSHSYPRLAAPTQPHISRGVAAAAKDRNGLSGGFGKQNVVPEKRPQQRQEPTFEEEEQGGAYADADANVRERACMEASLSAWQGAMPGYAFH